MKKGTLTYSIKLSQQQLNAMCDKAISEAISKESMEVNGVEVVLKKAGSVTAQLEGKSFVVQLPLDIELRRQAGLFTVEGTGGLSIRVKLNYDINSELQLHVKSELLDHKWTSKPVLELGALNVPVETLMNLMLNHYESILTAKIDEAINQRSQMSPLVLQTIRSLEDRINEQLPIAGRADLQLGTISNLTPRTQDGAVTIAGNIEVGLRLQPTDAPTDDQLPTVQWATEVGESKPLISELHLSYQDIAKQVLTLINGMDMGGRRVVVSDIAIAYDQHLNMELALAEPMKGKVTITGEPAYDGDAGTLDVLDLDVNVNPANIIYKMTTPLVNKFIETKLADYLPVPIGDIVAKKAAHMPEAVTVGPAVASPEITALQVHDMTFGSEGVFITVQVVGAHLAIEVV